MPTSESQRKAEYKYKKQSIKRIPLDVQIGKYDEIKAHSEKQRETVNGFIKRAIDEQIIRDNKKSQEKPSCNL